MGGKIPSFKIGEAKSIINQNRGGKIPSFKIGRAKSKFNQNKGVKLHLSLFFLKLGIRSKNRLIRGDQSHCPLAGTPFKARASSV